MLTFSVTVSDTSDTFLVATSENFQPTSFTVLVNFEAPIEKADQLCNYQKKNQIRVFLKWNIFRIDIKFRPKIKPTFVNPLTDAS